MSEAYSNQMPITPPDTGLGHPIDGETSHIDGPEGPFFVTDRLPVSPIDQTSLIENAAQYRDGKSIVIFYLDHAGIIKANEVIEIDVKGEEVKYNPVIDLVNKATDFYEKAFFKNFASDRSGLDGDSLMELYERTEQYESLPFLHFFRDLTDANQNIDQIRDAERIARILVLDEAQKLQ